MINYEDMCIYVYWVLWIIYRIHHLFVFAVSWLELCIFQCLMSSHVSGSSVLAWSTTLPLRSDVNDVPFALILPGFLGSCEDFEDLAEDMRRAGYAAAVAPIAWWHWVPCIGGRSMRPILERIDHAVNQVLTSDFKVKSLASPSYTIMDFFSDFMSNPGGIFQVGGTDDPAEFPPVKPAGDFRCDIPGKGQRIAIVAHSASGWISRLFLSSLEYQGRSFHGADKIHSLVCLGSPHFVANNLVYKNLEYLESKCGKDLPPNVRCLCVGSKGNVISEASAARLNLRKRPNCSAWQDEARAGYHRLACTFVTALL